MAKTKKQTEKQDEKQKNLVILNDGPNQRIWSIPEEGRLMRLYVEDGRLAISFEDEGDPRHTHPFQIMNLLSRISVEPILDQNRPFKVYDPGVVITRRKVQDQQEELV